jgi:hypothetical protein
VISLIVVLLMDMVGLPAARESSGSTITALLLRRRRVVGNVVCSVGDSASAVMLSSAS